MQLIILFVEFGHSLVNEVARAQRSLPVGALRLIGLRWARCAHPFQPLDLSAKRGRSLGALGRLFNLFCHSRTPSVSEIHIGKPKQFSRFYKIQWPISRGPNTDPTAHRSISRPLRFRMSCSLNYGIAILTPRVDAARLARRPKGGLHAASPKDAPLRGTKTPSCVDLSQLDVRGGRRAGRRSIDPASLRRLGD